MSKMTMPEMSVVRFQESDVIVASAIVLSGANDTDKHNLTITRYGTPIFSNSQQDGFNYLSDYGYNSDPNFYWSSQQGTSPYDLHSLITSDNNGDDYNDTVDGKYYWDGANFVRSRQ